MTFDEREALRRHTAQRLLAGGVENGRAEAKWMVEAIFAAQDGTDSTDSTDSTDCPADPMQRLDDCITRRIAGEPLQYLLGAWAFFGLEFAVGTGVLIPRQDTELLVETALAHRAGCASTRLLDLCSGSGCIAAAIAVHLPGVTGYALEYSPHALPYLRQNLRRHAPCLEILHADALSPPPALEDTFDLITCNPPYLTAQDMTRLQREVQFEPAAALFGGTDGLDFYRALTPLYLPRLAPGGVLLYEVGAGQAQAVAAMLEASGFVPFIHRDLCGIERVVGCRA